MDLLYLIVGWLLLGLIGAAIGQTRGRVDAGFLWGFLLGPLGWLVIILGPNPKRQKEQEEKRAQDLKLQKLQEQHIAEIRALRESVSAGRVAEKAAQEDRYWVRLEKTEIGPITKLELIELYAGGKLALDTPIAPDSGGDSRSYRALDVEIPALKGMVKRQ